MGYTHRGVCGFHLASKGTLEGGYPGLEDGVVADGEVCLALRAASPNWSVNTSTSHRPAHSAIGGIFFSITRL